MVLFWFRRDLRLHDNPALLAALQSGLPVLPLFIFDSEILNKLHHRRDARVLFIYQELKSLKGELEERGSSLMVYHGHPEEAFLWLIQQYPGVKAVYANRDYEPYALKRDERIGRLLNGSGILLQTFKDHVVFEKDEVLKNDGTPYTVFTPYSRKWKERLREEDLRPFASGEHLDRLYQTDPKPFPEIGQLGFESFEHTFPDRLIDHSLIGKYAHTRDLPALKGTSRLGIHLRFGTISIREISAAALKHGEVFLNELIWRNFFIQIMAHFPYATEAPFKKQYGFIEWRNDEHEFERWCRGETGYPMVDAGMRELNATGFMHNRVRMVTASFLCKHLLIDWRWGEAYFAEKLLDFELASNNGNWQWAAGTGCDAAPYFRVFNPETQQQKFDPDGVYVRKWVSEAGTSQYPRPMVDHKLARERAIVTYKKGIAV
jgi:deoxyribodipyrimidine photo-lyase